MPRYYYQQENKTYQIEADSFTQSAGAAFGQWFSTHVWNSGQTDVTFTGETDPLTVYTVPSVRCGANDQGQIYTVNGASFCGQNGTPPRVRSVSLSFSFVPSGLSCLTEFIKNGLVIRAVTNSGSCQQINIDPRDDDGCSQCCRELLSIARGISI